MTKAEIIVNISEKTGVEKIVVASIVEGFMSEVKSNVIDNKSIFLRGFGTFKPKKRARKKARALTGSFDVILRRKPALVLEAEKRIVVLILQRRQRRNR